MRLGILFGFFGLVGLALFIVWIMTLVDALRRPATEWERAGQNQLIWIGVIVFLHLLGALLYFLIARPALERAKT